jgi:hypothetical protein
MTEPITPETEEQKIEEQPEVVEAAQEEVPATDNSDAEMDAVLDRLLGIDSPEQTQETSTPETVANDAEYDKALRALQRDGVPADIIEAIKSNSSKVKEWGLKAAKRQADVDSFGAKVASEKKDAKPAEQPKASVKTDDKEADADPLSEFTEIFGEEASKPIRAMQQRMEQSLSEKTKALELKYESQMAYQNIRSEFGANAPSFEKVLEVAAELGRNSPAAYDSVNEIVRAAFTKIAGQPRKTDARSIAKPSVGKHVSRPTVKVDREDMALDILLSGGNRDDVRRVLSR